MKPFLEWDPKHYIGGDGVIIAADETQEWLLKWWFEHFKTSNQFPITVFDLGMSASARTWVKNKATVIPFALPKGMIHLKESIDPEKVAGWENRYEGDLWQGRLHWFSKPFLLLKSPYDRTIWMDLDCEVSGKIDPLFDYCNEKDGFSIFILPVDGLELFNTGVMVSKRHSPIPLKWAESVYKENGDHFGDEPLLMEVVKREKFFITPHPITYNFPTNLLRSPNAVIKHHIGGRGKTQIIGGYHV